MLRVAQIILCNYLRPIPRLMNDMTRFLLASTLIACGVYTAALPAQTFDTSGNSLLTGNYFVRHVAFDNFTTAGLPGRSRSFTGTYVFDGAGNYTSTGQVSDNTASSGTAQAFSFKGTYSVSSSGLLRMQDPLSTNDLVWGGVGKSAIVGSSTESNEFDMLIGVPVSGSVTNAALQGQYRVAALDITNGNVSQARNSTFLLTADGNGGLGTLSVVGRAANLNDTEQTQTVSNAVYALSGAGGSASSTLTFPLPSGGTALTQFLSGTKQFAVSSDGNILVGGGVNTYDIVVGVRAATSGGNSSYSGTFYSAGMDYDNSGASTANYYFDGFYGSVTANGIGTALNHQRINPSTDLTYDYTWDDEFTLDSTGGFVEPFERFYVGAGGQARILAGGSSLYSIELDVIPKTVAASGSVYLNPLGIVNAASYSPVTNPITPGEMIRLYGTGLSGVTMTASALPLPTNLGGVSVSVNGVAAPIYQVTSTQIVCIVPFATTSAGYAQVQVTNNGTKSNTVTMFTETSAPGVFTLGANGISTGATLHANGSVVSASSPAKVGETVVTYVTGLGAVSPAVTDGTGAPSSPLSLTTDHILVFVEGQQATVTFAGLAPSFVGLYQVNFVVPGTQDNGEVYLDIADSDSGAYASQATIIVSGNTGAASVGAAKPEVRQVVRASAAQRKATAKRAGSRISVR